jgi:hypothetical protein
MAGPVTARSSRNFRQITRKALPVEQANVHDVAKNSGADFLATDLTPNDTPSLFRVQVSLDTAAVFSVEIKKGGTAKIVEFNSGAQLIADSLYFFDHLMHSGDTCNYQADQNVQVDILRVQEVGWAVQ